MQTWHNQYVQFIQKSGPLNVSAFREFRNKDNVFWCLFYDDKPDYAIITGGEKSELGISVICAPCCKVCVFLEATDTLRGFSIFTVNSVASQSKDQTLLMWFAFPVKFTWKARIGNMIVLADIACVAGKSDKQTYIWCVQFILRIVWSDQCPFQENGRDSKS